VRAGLRDGPVPANADGGRLQNGAGETYMVAPERYSRDRHELVVDI